MGKDKAMRVKYLIIGNSAGGIAAAESIRDVDKSGSIAIVTDEPYPSYSRPLIAKYLSRERSPDGMLFRSAEFYEQNNINVLLGERVGSLGLR
jgi:NAD(P)H-nitrite reductase large subunit